MRSRVLPLLGQIGLLCLVLISSLPMVALLSSSAWGQLRQPLSTVDVGAWSVDDAFPQSNFSQNGAMQMLQHPLHDNIFYVCTWKGTIIELRREQSGLQERTIVDLSDGDIRWAFGCALHPNFRADGSGDERIFIHYTTEPKGSAATPKYLRISQIRLPSQGVARSAQETVLIQNDIEHREHVGGGLDFDERGFLMVSIGDSGWHDDGRSTSQKIDEGLFSGIMRIDIDRRGGSISHPPKRQPQSGKTAGYFIPSDNPFVGQPGVLEEFWALGLRNPWRISYDTERRALWIGEVGQNLVEQIELARSGTNHEWSYMEGGRRFEHSYLNGQRPASPIGELTSPLYEYEHLDQNYAVVGGFVYRGNKFPELKGKYIFGDNQSSRIWAIDPTNPVRKLILRLPSGRKRMALTSISGDRAGNIYFTSFASINHANVLQLVPSTPANMPDRLSQTGIFTDLATLQPSSGFLAYDVNSPLWSDGMTKRRWLKLPAGTQIDNTTHENWRFPTGSVFVKHFQEPTGARRAIETRVLTVKADGHVFGATYVWNDSQNEALLQTGRSSQTATAHGGQQFQYRVPSARDCTVCHTYEYPVLGVNGLQLSGNNSTAGTSNDPIVAWSQLGMFTRDVPASVAASLPALAPLTDNSVPLQHRVRSYLHSNCSFCHYPTGTQRTLFDARIITPLDNARMIDEAGMTNYLTIDGSRADFIVASGDPENSAIYRRLRTVERELSMPYLARTIADPLALTSVAKWITELSDSAVSAPTSSNSCNYTNADVNDGWGWNTATGQSCAPLHSGGQTPDTGGTNNSGDTNASGCDYSQAASNGGWGWNPTTRQSCPPQTSPSQSTDPAAPSNPTNPTSGNCDYSHAAQNSGWGWNETSRQPCPPQ